MRLCIEALTLIPVSTVYSFQLVRRTHFSQYDALVSVSTAYSFQLVRRTRFSLFPKETDKYGVERVPLEEVHRLTHALTYH